MMTAVEQNNLAKQEESAAVQQTSKKTRNRQSDDGPDVLPCMEHFVTLVRKVKRPALIVTLDANPDVIANCTQSFAGAHVAWWELVGTSPTDNLPKAAQADVGDCPLVAADRVP